MNDPLIKSYAKMIERFDELALSISDIINAHSRIGMQGSVSLMIAIEDFIKNVTNDLAVIGKSADLRIKQLLKELDEKDTKIELLENRLVAANDYLGNNKDK